MRLVGVMLACAAVLAAQTVEGTVVNPVTKAGVADADVLAQVHDGIRSRVSSRRQHDART
jgi:hypothetical protein